MKRPSEKIEWTVAEDEEIWQAGQDGPSAAADRPFYLREVWLAGLIATVLLLLLFGGWFARRPAASALPKDVPQRGVVQASNAVTENVQWQGIAPFETGSQVGKVERRGDRAMVQVIVQQPDGGIMRAYRETRFFATSADEWEGVLPDPALLGDEKTLKVANFTIVYRVVDADAVYQVVPRLEKRYALMRHDFGLPVADASTGYAIEVTTAYVATPIDFNEFEGKMTISSPILLSVPVEMTPETLLYQEMLYPLARLTLAESIEQHDALWKLRFMEWPAVTNALVLWEVWDAGGPLASEHDGLVRWFYENSQSQDKRRPLPDNYHVFCRTYQFWQLILPYFSIPLHCSEEEAKMRSVENVPLLTPAWRQESNDHCKCTSPDDRFEVASITLESVIEYMTATYGRDKLPQLVQALGEESSPDVLVPALFGVSRQGFEAGWQSYLAQHF